MRFTGWVVASSLFATVAAEQGHELGVTHVFSQTHVYHCVQVSAAIRFVEHDQEVPLANSSEVTEDLTWTLTENAALCLNLEEICRTAPCHRSVGRTGTGIDLRPVAEEGGSIGIAIPY